MNDRPNEFGDGRPDIATIKEMRREHPSGWLELSMYEARALMIDALLDAPPNHTFTNPELAARAGVSDESVRGHIDVLVDLGIVEPIEANDPVQYRVNDDSRVLGELFALNSAVNAVHSGKSSTIKQSFPRSRETPVDPPKDLSATETSGEEIEGERTPPSIDDFDVSTSRRPRARVDG